MPPRRPLEERFWEKVDKNGPTMPHMATPCWVWTASREDAGYGRCFLGTGGWDRAHRVSFKLHNGGLTDDQCILHHCDNRACVRFDHLYEGTRKDNAQDRERRHRGNHAVGARHGCATHPGLHSGARNGRAKLNEASVKQLLQDFKQGTRKADLARAYGLSGTTVSHIVSGKLWPQVER